LLLLFAAGNLISRLLPASRRRLYYLCLLLSPAFTVLWLCFPLDCLKIFLLSIIIFFVFNRRLSSIIAIFIILIFLIIFNLKFLHQRPPILSALNIHQSQQEVTRRISQEDSTNPHVNLPLWFRRLSYNKYFVTFKNAIYVSMNFWDVESLFFQEIHPLDQKSVVIFYWPQAFLLVIILWLFSARLPKIFRRQLLLLLIISWLYFLLADDIVYKRLIFVLFWLPLVFAWGLSRLFKSPGRWLIYPLIILIAYGYLANYADRRRRPDYWLDNRPLIYSHLFQSPAVGNYHQFHSVYLADYYGLAAKYCRYYLRQCPNFSYTNFNLSVSSLTSDSLYLGYIGNFIGQKNDNNFDLNSFNIWADQHQLTIIDHFSLRDTVVFSYGNDLFIGYHP